MQCIFCYGEIWNNICPICQQRSLNQKKKHSIRIHHRQRIITKRINIVTKIWKTPESQYCFTPGKLDKHNLSCNCWMCKGEKKAGIEKQKYLSLNLE
jgi:hypothetical protein